MSRAFVHLFCGDWPRLFGELLYDCQRFLDVRIGRKAVVLGGKGGNDLVVFADDECGAFDQVMVDHHAAHICMPGFTAVLVRS